MYNKVIQLYIHIYIYIYIYICIYVCVCMGFPGGSDCRESAYNAEDLGLTLCGEDPLEKGMATHSSFLAWRSPWIEELDGLKSPWRRRVGHD